MTNDKGKLVSRAALAILVLLSGLAMLPFTGLSAEQLGWQQYAGVYEPKLNVNEDKGFPGSAFYYTGTDYPPNSVATVYIDGNPVGMINIDGNGFGEFLIQTRSTDPLSRYYITLATDPNTSDTEDFRLEDDEPLWPPPPGYNGPVFYLDDPVLTPTATSTATVVPTATSTAVPTATATPTGTPPVPEYYRYLPAVFSP